MNFLIMVLFLVKILSQHCAVMELEEKGLAFEEIVQQLEAFRDEMNTYFVLNNLETLRKNGRLTGVKALVASTLNIKPVMGATEEGTIIQLGQAIGLKKALQKMADGKATKLIIPSNLQDITGTLASLAEVVKPIENKE
mgnify:CR=1 FL=1